MKEIDQEAVRRLVDDVVRPNVAQWDRDDVLPAEVLERLGALGVPGALVPEAYGGCAVPVADMVDVWRTLAQGWISLTGAVNTTALGTQLLVRYGTEEQRQRWLPGIATGEVWSSFSITEPGAGSDLRRLATTVEPAEGGLVVTGRKRWIAGGFSFPLTFMLARIAGQERPSCVVLPSEGRGSETWKTEPLDKLGYRGVESAAWTFDAHFVPGAEILGGAEGQGARQMVDVLSVGRVNVACRGLGIIDRALEGALGEATGREIGPGVLGDYSHTALRIGELRARQLVVEAAVRRAAEAIDGGEAEAGERASAAKTMASESAVWAVEQASRLAASRSYTEGDELARLRRDAPQTQIGEGANDSLLIAAGRAMIKRRTA
ncbi:acyl-CoA/acyl-ACP dehydrogenase [Solirubrobacter sp. CPCC 204708]|uniref:Acyl-CoA/acyl-ACP dehydrogenase n=1 Tax=Solirubrobacter deserti TaxID=2282478 RepID=A0ABT4RFJ6_9ACTN|nr:acyl-CoA dehydrogenase family protein [Solirubrobacter deserti]MBE2319418.1 acyl-CoA/acyl-ACP dehydrogenase [Solirubrobacter deserti]MDA0137297.1 acyl-CoA/acyl-ACP dehydrogenase [Solirubrobacter deserti]